MDMGSKAVNLSKSTSAPSQSPTALGLAPVSLGSAIVVFGALASGSGDCQLWNWQQEGSAGAGDWYPYGEPFPADSAVNSGKFLARFATDHDSSAYFFLQLPAGSSASEALIKGVRL